MIYQFQLDPGLRGHDLEADIKITPGMPATREQPEEGAQLECFAVWMVRGVRRRLLRGKLGAWVEDQLVERTQEILDQWEEAAADKRADRQFEEHRERERSA